MTTWDSLPAELRNLVLEFFCLTVVEEYEDLHIEWNDGEYNALAELKWPKPPECLSSLASALRTCRYFHDIITRIIKVDGESVVKTLHELQFNKLIATDVALYGFPKPHVGLYFNTVGRFWRNPKLAEDNNFIGILKLWNDPKSSLMLIPHLEDWVKKYHTSSASSDHQQIHLALSDAEGGAELVLLSDTDGRPIVSGCDALKICPIAEFYEVRDRNNPKAAHHRFKRLPIVQDINSDTHSWWLFRRSKFQWDGSEVNKWWCLVNYKTKQMHMRPQYTSSVTFDDVWNPSRRKRYQPKRPSYQ